MKYLVKTIKHTTGEEFTDTIKVKNNEDYVIVEAESAEEAKRIAEYKNISDHFIELSLRKDSE